MAHHICAPHLGRSHFPSLHDRLLHFEEGLYNIDFGNSASYWNCRVVMVHLLIVPPAQQIRLFEFCL
jgi:hypothetical protein